MAELTFRHDIKVTEVQAVGSDAMVVASARVSTVGLDPCPRMGVDEGDAHLIDFLIRNRHASPFEHGTMTVAVEAPIFVARQWMRHRTQSYNETSGRYRELEPVFYDPPEGRPMVQEGKPGEYRFVEDERLRRNASRAAVSAARHCWALYEAQLAVGVAREVAREVLPTSLYTSWYATANLRGWLNFLSLRTHEEGADVPSFPQAEIEEGARKVEALVAARWPVSHASWARHGRGSL